MTSRLLTIRVKFFYAFGGSKPPPYEQKIMGSRTPCGVKKSKIESKRN